VGALETVGGELPRSIEAEQRRIGGFDAAASFPADLPSAAGSPSTSRMSSTI